MVAIGAKAFALLEEGKKVSVAPRTLIVPRKLLQRKEENEEEQMMNKGSKMVSRSHDRISMLN